MPIERTYWLSRMKELLAERTVLWLSGVRRSGKTTLCKQLPDSLYFDCELPRVRSSLEDPEHFFSRHRQKTLILDEIHRLLNPSEVLKIAADHFPDVRVVATGSSTLAAKHKFKDTLTGRKNELRILPSIIRDLSDFSVSDLERRMLHGGLPPFLLEAQMQDAAYQEWIDSYWAKDIQELFVVEKRASFLKFIELLFVQSGQLYEASALATPAEISRQTAQNYLSILETTLLVHVLRPYSASAAREIKSQPKVFAFDTGFVCYFKGIAELRSEDRGLLLEHLVLGELLAKFAPSQVFYWRDKQHHEIDFVIKPGRSQKLTAVECKTKPNKFSPESLLSFRSLYPEGNNIVVCLDLAEPYEMNFGTCVVQFVPFFHLWKAIQSSNI